MKSMALALTIKNLDGTQRSASIQHVFIDSIEEFRTSTCQRIIESSCVVGIDAEWPPFDTSGPPKACLLQLACLVVSDGPAREDGDNEHKLDGHGIASIHVFVIDVRTIAADDDVGHNILRDIFKGLLKSPACLKVGHSLDADVKAIYCALGLPIQGLVVKHAVDVKHLFTRFWHMRAPGLYGTFKDKGLSAIMDSVLGVTLDKTLQCSDWNQRPLQNDQILYAANDASCLLNLFLSACSMYVATVDGDDKVDVRKEGDFKFHSLAGEHVRYCLKNIPSSFSIDKDVLYCCIAEFGQEWTWNRMGKLVTSKKTGFWKKQWYGAREAKVDVSGRSKKSKIQGGVLPNLIPWERDRDKESIPKFICDVMLHGLARQLRLWGVDCDIAPTLPKSERYLTHRRLVEIAEDQGRVILTKDTTLYARKISDQMYFVVSETKSTQAEEVLKMFKVQVGLHTLMSRCSACNGNFYREPRRPEQLVEGHGLPKAVLEHVDEFWVCSSCSSVYWKGGQYKRSMDKLINDFERMFSSH